MILTSAWPGLFLFRLGRCVVHHGGVLGEKITSDGGHLGHRESKIVGLSSSGEGCTRANQDVPLLVLPRTGDRKARGDGSGLPPPADHRADGATDRGRWL